MKPENDLNRVSPQTFHPVPELNVKQGHQEPKMLKQLKKVAQNAKVQHAGVRIFKYFLFVVWPECRPQRTTETLRSSHTHSTAALFVKVQGRPTHLSGLVCVVRPAGDGDDRVHVRPTCFCAVPADVT